MRKFVLHLITLVWLLVPLASSAQTSVSGRVVNDKDGTPVEGATVLVKGAKTGTSTNSSGNFTITVPAGGTLVISSVNYNQKEVKVKNNTELVIRLQKADGTLDEVVVTAMDIKRNPKELSYSTQKVGGSDIQESQRENFVNALQGRVAGLTINQTGGAAGSSSQIVLRGFNSLSLDNSPLFVIDGVIADNSTLNETSSSGIGLGLASDRPNRGNDYSSRISDINPNDIQSIEFAKMRIEAARAAEEFAKQQLAGEEKRFSAGLSTTYFVLQRQNEYSIARGSTLRALTDYNKLVAQLQRDIGTTLTNNNVEVKSDANGEKK